jgi:amino acid transporter
VIEYVILIGFAIVGIYAVASHWPGTFHWSSGWFSPTGIKGGGGSAVAGFLIAVFIFTGWDGAVYVNEEVKQKRRNPGRAALLAVGLLAGLLWWPATAVAVAPVKPVGQTRRTRRRQV